MRRTIAVTASDIRYGRRESSISCPVALAIKRELDPSDINVDDTDLSLTIGELSGRADLPAKVCKFIAAFDKIGRKAVRPMTFRLEVRLER